MKNIVIIPVRSGSKRLKGKNRLKLLGKSLVDWTVNFASKLNFIDDIIVSTDDELIIKENKNHKFVKLLRRPKYLAKDKTKTVPIILTSKPFKIDINTKKDLVDIKSLMLKNKDLTFNYA